MAHIGPLSVSKQGFGCMGFSHSYGQADDAESLRTLDKAIELGITFFDTADIYGRGHNETLLGKAIAGRRNKLVIATKFGNRLDRDTTPHGLDGSRAYVQQAIEASLKRLNIEVIDLYYLHRVDPKTPIEETVGALADLKKEGKIRAIGLSEVSAATLRRASKVHPIDALQSEYSLWTRDVESEILPTCQELNIAFIPFSPLGRGFLAGSLPTESGDRRHEHPRFQADAVAANKVRQRLIENIAARLDATAAQISLAWLLSKGTIPIPGTRHISHLEDNWAANNIRLDAATIAELEDGFPPGSTVGARYTAEALARVNA